MRPFSKIEWTVMAMTVVVCILSFQFQIVLTRQQLERAQSDLREERANLVRLTEHLQTHAASLETVRVDVDAASRGVAETRVAMETARHSMSDALSAESLAREESEKQSSRDFAGAVADVRLRLRHVQGTAGNAALWSAANAKEIGSLRSKVVVDHRQLARSVLGPSVKVETDHAVGGGTCIGSRLDAAGTAHTYILTADHVVASAVREKHGVEKRDPVEVKRYPPGGGVMAVYTADIVARDEGRDLALLKIRDGELFPCVAELATRAELERLDVFDRVTAVGCPLGHAPLPTEGELVQLTKMVRGRKFWMMNAPTIFGNSGGGVFAEESSKLIGVSAMICVYDSLVSMPVTHLGVLVPMTGVYDWLDSQCYEFLYDPRFTREECELRRNVLRAVCPLVVSATWEEK